MPERVASLRGPSHASLRLGNTVPFEEMLQRWRAVSNTVSDLTSARFEPQISRSKDELARGELESKVFQKCQTWQTW